MGVQGSPQHTFEKVPCYPEHRSLLHAYFFSAEAIIRILNGRLQFPMPGVDKKPEKSRCLELWSGPQMVKTLWNVFSGVRGQKSLKQTFKKVTFHAPLSLSSLCVHSTLAFILMSFSPCSSEAAKSVKGLSSCCKLGVTWRPPIHLDHSPLILGDGGCGHGPDGSCFASLNWVWMAYLWKLLFRQQSAHLGSISITGIGSVSP